MSYSSFTRLGGLAAMVGGVVYAGVGLTEARLAEYLYYVNNIGYGFVAILLPLGRWLPYWPCMPCTENATAKRGWCFA